MRVRLLAVLSVAALFLFGALPASATSEGHGYLALGDSVPFGFNPDRSLWSNANNFTGYPELVARQLNIEDTNATCPGEATGGFLSLAGFDNGCQGYRFFLREPLHVMYPGTQMAFALAYLRSRPDTRLVTLTLGANDYFHLQHVCGFDPACVGAGIPAMLVTMGANLNAILDGIRSTGYTGLIVALTYYSLIYPDTSGADLLNGPMIAAANAHGALVASGVEAWRSTAMENGGSTCYVGGLRLPPFPPDPGIFGCDVHPTPLGATLLADAVVSTIASSCPANSAIGCLNRHQG